MAQVGIRTYEAYKTINNCNGWEPHVRTAKSAAAAPRRAKRADVDGLQPSPEASEVTGAVTCLNTRFSVTPHRRKDRQPLPRKRPDAKDRGINTRQAGGRPTGWATKFSTSKTPLAGAT
jgi:hypothetical protein